MLGTKRCNGCWEVEHRLYYYLEAERGPETLINELCRAGKLSVGASEIWEYDLAAFELQEVCAEVDDPDYVICWPRSFLEDLNARGKEGWELVSIQDEVFNGRSWKRCLFKRKVQRGEMRVEMDADLKANVDGINRLWAETKICELLFTPPKAEDENLFHRDKTGLVAQLFGEAISALGSVGVGVRLLGMTKGSVVKMQVGVGERICEFEIRHPRSRPDFSLTWWENLVEQIGSGVRELRQEEIEK